MRMSNEFKAGVVILVGVLLAGYFIMKTTNFRSEPYRLKTYFTYAGDLKNDAVVKLSGIEVGRLEEINFIYGDDTKVECVFSLDKKAKVRTDAIAYIGTAGFVGDAYIGLTPGTNKEYLKDGGVVASEDPVQMRELMKKADTIAEELDGTLKEFKNLAGNLNGVIDDNKGGIAKTIGNLELISENFKEFSEDVKKHPWKLLFKGE